MTRTGSTVEAASASSQPVHEDSRVDENHLSAISRADRRDERAVHHDGNSRARSHRAVRVRRWMESMLSLRLRFASAPNRSYIGEVSGVDDGPDPMMRGDFPSSARRISPAAARSADLTAVAVMARLCCLTAVWWPWSRQESGFLFRALAPERLEAARHASDHKESAGYRFGENVCVEEYDGGATERHRRGPPRCHRAPAPPCRPSSCPRTARTPRTGCGCGCRLLPRGSRRP